MRKLTEVDFDQRFVAGEPDVCWLWLGGRCGDYGAFGKGRYAHQHAFERAHGPIPDGSHVDHRCRNRMCVNPAHLRLATNRQNSCNSGPRRGSSAFKGVSRAVPRSLQPTAELAAAAYDIAAAEHFGEFAYLNFPQAA